MRNYVSTSLSNALNVQPVTFPTLSTSLFSIGPSLLLGQSPGHPRGISSGETPVPLHAGFLGLIRLCYRSLAATTVAKSFLHCLRVTNLRHDCVGRSA